MTDFLAKWDIAAAFTLFLLFIYPVIQSIITVLIVFYGLFTKNIIIFIQLLLALIYSFSNTNTKFGNLDYSKLSPQEMRMKTWEVFRSFNDDVASSFFLIVLFFFIVKLIIIEGDKRP